MNEELAYHILGVLQTIQEAVAQMQRYYGDGDIEEFNSLSRDVWDGLTAVREVILREVPKESNIKLADACVCAMESLKNIKVLAIANPQKVGQKLEFELISILRTMILQFYYWGIAKEHPEKECEFRAYLRQVGVNRYVGECEKQGLYKYEISIVVIGYNNLDYTKQCVESILRQLPSDITYEIIFLNHGSSDGTKLFFNSIEKAKTIDVAVNGAVPGIALQAIEGKYVIIVSNDVVLGANVIENLYKCLSEHSDYGWVVPTTPNVSNLQTISANYNSEEEFYEFTERNNLYDERRHEQRVRLCNPISAYKASVGMHMYTENYIEVYCSENVQSFPDDKMSLLMRRSGLKMILAKDAYCHHFGSVTLKNELGNSQKQLEFYNEGRRVFQVRWGIDPWGLGFCFDPKLFGNWDISYKDNGVVLGINCGIGSNSLKVKELLREKGAQSVVLYNATQKEKYLQDLQGVSDVAFLFSEISDIVEKTGRVEFSHIIVEEISGMEPNNFVQEILDFGLKFEELVYKDINDTWVIVKRDAVTK